MTDITNLHSLLDWKLLRGSHDWPGSDGGTCINEAAIVAAGLPYRSVSDAADCPDCFSPVLSAYLIGINDMMPDDERQKLIRFVLRLPGSADTKLIERMRIEFILTETVKRIVAAAMCAVGRHHEANDCASVKSIDEAKRAAARAARAADAAMDAWAASAAWAASDASTTWAPRWAARWAVRAASDASAAWAPRWAAKWVARWAARWAASDASAAWAPRWAARAASDARAAIYNDCIAIAECAFDIGNQAAQIDVNAAQKRMEEIKQTEAA